MASKEDDQNLEYATLLSLTDRLILGISMDRSVVAQKLVTEGIIATTYLDPSTQAVEIFHEVLKAVEINPESFEKFLRVVNECPCIKNLAELVQTTYEEKKQQQAEIKLPYASVKSKSEDTQATRLGSASYQDQENKFPFLMDEGMTKEQRERLIGRLEHECGRMKNKFAILVDRARESLEVKKISINELKVLIKHSSRNNLVKLFEKMKRKKISNLFYVLSEYWSFFDYEFLALIIERHCPELKTELDKYVDSLKTFCRRRLCEIPSDIFETTKGRKNNLYVKCGQEVYKMKLETAKDLEHKLSELLDTELYLLHVQEGRVEIIFDSYCNLNDKIPLSNQQNKQLSEMGVTSLRYGKNASVLLWSNTADASQSTDSYSVKDTEHCV